MISKFKEIHDLAVFRNFIWDKSVIQAGEVKKFQNINIIYGRNYSGKTTLSRILSAIERRCISEKYINSKFCVTFDDETEIHEDNLRKEGIEVRVFNHDFITENLKFIVNPNEGVAPFAVLGELNNETETEIRRLELELGSNDEGRETGLFDTLKILDRELTNAKSNYFTRKNALEKKLSEKAIDRERGIKYNSEINSDINYNRPKLDIDIETVSGDAFQSLTTENKSDLKTLIHEKTLAQIPPLPKLTLSLNTLSKGTELLVKQEIGESERIEELVKESLLNNWVKQGVTFHKGKRENCAFCGNNIEEDRWSLLEKHFDEESLKLEEQINVMVSKIEDEISFVSEYFKPNKYNFYSSYHGKIDELTEQYDKAVAIYKIQLGNLIEQLEKRKSEIIRARAFIEVNDSSHFVEQVANSYESMRVSTNEASETLNYKQRDAKDLLRLQEVYEFLNDIDYSGEVESIEDLRNIFETAEDNHKAVSERIADGQQKIQEIKNLLKDEVKGALQVNAYLNNFFGHIFLSLKAIEDRVDPTSPVIKYRFEIFRGEEKAYNLSEGECSLIAFCYFMAKQSDIETKDKKPIIWIDDPISSLDSNHIFFIYSLIRSEIVNKGKFEQLFISTHNLDFLKYLKRLTGYFLNDNGKNQEYSRSFFIVERQGEDSNIRIMPKFMKDYVTEFNYLFKQIYDCAMIAEIDDSNFTIFYNFGNNARKFLEIYLYYKYPDNASGHEKRTKFFGEELHSTIVERVINEYSHLEGGLERGSTPISDAEITMCAKLILNKLKEDHDQYESLIKSINL
jgi:wobble nucleotide-excising tRNase